MGLNNRLTGQFQRRPYTDQGTRYADFFYLRRHLQGEDVSRNVNLGELVNFIVPIEADAELRADGYDVILAFFDLTEEYFVEQVEVEAVVGNDYRVELVGLYEAEPQGHSGTGALALGQPRIAAPRPGQCPRPVPMRRRSASTPGLGLAAPWSALTATLKEVAPAFGENSPAVLSTCAIQTAGPDIAPPRGI